MVPKWNYSLFLLDINKTRERDMETKTIQHRLIGFENDGDYRLIEPAKGLMFGKLVDLSIEVVQHYRSDYYHDAKWIQEHVDGPSTFYYGFREWGTSIGTDPKLVAYGNDKLFRVDLVLSEHEWFVVLTEMDAPFQIR
jgi:hypothetical protein